MKITSKIQIDGMDDLFARLRNLRQSIQNKHMRRAVTKSARVVAAAVSARAPVESGALKKSIGYRVYTMKTGKGVGAVIGPKRDFKVQVGQAATRTRAVRLRILSKKQLAAGATGAARCPAKYAHLVEFGHRVAVGGTLSRRVGWRRRQIAAKSKRTDLRGKGRHAGNVAARPFLRPAWDASLGEIRSLIRRELAAGIAEEAKKKGK